VASDSVIPYPSVTSDLHHEVELVAALGAGGADVAVEDALALVFGYAVGVDLTRRDQQAAARAKGQPWDAAKGFDQSAPISAIRPADGGPPQGRIRLAVNGEARQDASLGDMIWNVAEIISQASRLWRLEPGDLFFTGTPEGVGPLVSGDEVLAEVDGVGRLTFGIG
jgi:fumarylpyruvate hydrolase